jgi:hypothetical protein
MRINGLTCVTSISVPTIALKRNTNELSGYHREGESRKSKGSGRKEKRCSRKIRVGTIEGKYRPE